VRETALADIQKEVVTAEQGVNIAELQASATVKQAAGEAEAIRLTGEAKADAYQAGVESLGSQAYTALQLMQVIGDRQVRVVPDVSVSGNGSGSGLMDSLLGMLVWKQAQEMTGNGHSHDGEQPDAREPAEDRPSLVAAEPPAPPPPTEPKPLTIPEGVDFVNIDNLLK
jgi:hypothetical protein